MTDIARLYQDVREAAKQIALLASIQASLEWDERTMLPPEGSEYRAEQATLLSGMVHTRWTDPKFVAQVGELAELAKAEPSDGDVAATARRLKRKVDKKTKLPQSLVEELTRTAVLGQHAWEAAKKNNDFPAFEPLLTKMLGLKRQEAEALGYADVPYDALLDDYEPEEKTANVARVLSGLRERLVPLVAAIGGAKKRPDATVLCGHFPAARQEALGRHAAEAIGFDFRRGRLDVTAHPFCTSLGPNDHRITTRYLEDNVGSALFGILHESGHAIYEQGLPPEHFGQPLGEAVSLGIHESQSRLWENQVGRSLAFWKWLYPRAQAEFPEQLGKTPLAAFHFAINQVQPSLIRIEADEATYNLHILVRFELEQALLAGDLPVSDLPGAWNDRYRQYLGIVPPTDAMGVLQDVHWSAGLVGYFPTYALGNLYAATFFAQAAADLGDLDEQIARGEFAPLRQWLRTKIHRHGQRYSAAELVERVTGRPLSPEPLMRHLETRLKPLYGLA